MVKMTEEDYRSIQQKYKNMMVEDIKEALKPGRHNFSLLIDNRTKNFAAGTLVRSFNNFSGQKIILWGSKQYDRRPSIGCYQVEEIEVARSIEELGQIVRQSGIDRLVALENNVDRPLQDLRSYRWDKGIHSLMIIGNEHGIDSEILDVCDDFVEIPSMGSTKSINLGAAGSIMMWDYISKIDT